MRDIIARSRKDVVEDGACDEGDEKKVRGFEASITISTPEAPSGEDIWRS